MSVNEFAHCPSKLQCFAGQIDTEFTGNIERKFHLRFSGGPKIWIQCIQYSLSDALTYPFTHGTQKHFTLLQSHNLET